MVTKTDDQRRAGFEALINRHGLCATKDGDLYRSHLVGWMLKAYEAALTSPEVQALRKDAERYQWLRQQHWSDSEMCIVCRPKETVRPGGYCPSLALLDSHIDAAMEKQK